MPAEIGLNVSAANLREVLESIGRGEGSTRSGWFTRLVTAYLHYRDARHPSATAMPVSAAPEVARAQQVIRSACIKSAIGGVTSGIVTTGATLLTGEAPVAAVITLPVAALGIGAEMILRALIHLDMTCDLAAIFGQRFDPHQPLDFWQLYGLAFKTHGHEDEDDGDPGKGLVHRLGEAEVHDIGETIGDTLLGESVLKNIIPFLGIATASVTNWKRTRALGDTVRRYLRYRRAIGDSIEVARDLCEPNLDVLIEGLWFIFIADGRLAPEEATVLAGLLRRLDPPMRHVVEGRFIQDEGAWVERLGALPAEERPALLHALEVGAAVDKKVSLPEQKLLDRAARALGLDLDMGRVEKMIQTFEEVGVLDTPPPPP